MPAIGRAAVAQNTADSASAANKKHHVKRKYRMPSARATTPRTPKRSKSSTSFKTRNIGAYGNATHDRIAKWVRDEVRDQSWFQTSLIGVIFLAGILVGVSTYDISDKSALQFLNVLDLIVLVIFIVEIVVKVIAEGNKPLDFLRDAWNVFDFLIVVASLLPFGGSAVTALRLVRLLRVLKLVRALPKLRILVMGLFLSMSSIAYIGLLLMLLFYLYAVLGVSMLGLNDPVHFGTLHFAMLTLFRCATLEDWTDVMYIGMYGCKGYGYGGMEDLCTDSSEAPLLSIFYFVSFTILSSMMILNLFIGVITSSMAEAKKDLSDEAEAEKGSDSEESVDVDDVLEEEMKTLSDELHFITKAFLIEAKRERRRKDKIKAETAVHIIHGSSTVKKQLGSISAALASSARQRLEEASGKVRNGGADVSDGAAVAAGKIHASMQSDGGGSAESGSAEGESIDVDEELRRLYEAKQAKDDDGMGEMGDDNMSVTEIAPDGTITVHHKARPLKTSPTPTLSPSPPPEGRGSAGAGSDTGGAGARAGGDAARGASLDLG